MQTWMHFSFVTFIHSVYLSSSFFSSLFFFLSQAYHQAKSSNQTEKEWKAVMNCNDWLLSSPCVFVLFLFFSLFSPSVSVSASIWAFCLTGNICYPQGSQSDLAASGAAAIAASHRENDTQIFTSTTDAAAVSAYWNNSMNSKKGISPGSLFYHRIRFLFHSSLFPLVSCFCRWSGCAGEPSSLLCILKGLWHPRETANKGRDGNSINSWNPRPERYIDSTASVIVFIFPCPSFRLGWLSLAERKFELTSCQIQLELEGMFEFWGSACVRSK